jgi:hypothetical protein
MPTFFIDLLYWLDNFARNAVAAEDFDRFEMDLTVTEMAADGRGGRYYGMSMVMSI